MEYVIHCWIRKIIELAIPPDPYFEFKKKRKERKAVIELCLSKHDFFSKVRGILKCVCPD